MTLVPESPVRTSPSFSRSEALALIASGRTAAGLLRQAASAAAVDYVAGGDPALRGYARELILAASAAVGAVETKAVTRARCPRQAGRGPS